MLWSSYVGDVVYGVFFFKQKTAYELRISDWSSDVCSSDLPDFYKKRLDMLAKATPAAVTAAMQKWLRRPVYSLRVVPGERGAYEEAAASKGSRTGVLASPAYYRLPDDGGFGSATIRQPVAAVDRSKLDRKSTRLNSS